ncbi:MAG: hypothetical protein PHU14_11825 [Methylovulum sp.]|nr:hypothetical protein [Methylovulum sp.]
MKKEPEVDIVDPYRHPYFKQEPLPVHIYNVAVWGLVAITGKCGWHNNLIPV